MDARAIVKGLVVFTLTFGVFVLAKPKSGSSVQEPAPIFDAVSDPSPATKKATAVVNGSERAATPQALQSQTETSSTASLGDSSGEAATTSDVWMNLGIAGNDKPILIFKTNLPPKSILMVTVANPINRGGNGYFAQQQGRVEEDQMLRFGPFTESGNRLMSGKYQVTIQTIMAAFQPQEIQPFFGNHGDKLVGPQIVLLPGTAEKVFSASFEVVVNPDEAQSTATP